MLIAIRRGLFRPSFQAQYRIAVREYFIDVEFNRRCATDRALSICADYVCRYGTRSSEKTDRVEIKKFKRIQKMRALP